ncbi:hypothetical protein MASR1M8_02880 [Thermomonas brevis]
MAVMATASAAGFFVDMSLRQFGGRGETLRTSSAVTLYGGLLTSSTEAGCGYWSLQATDAAKSDIDKPLPEAIASRLAQKPLGHWVSVMKCKAPEILHPPAYALKWLMESPNVRDRRMEAGQGPGESNYRWLLRIESAIYGVFTLLILFSVAVTCVLLWRKGKRALGMVGVLWVASFWLVHLVSRFRVDTSSGCICWRR